MERYNERRDAIKILMTAQRAVFADESTSVAWRKLYSAERYLASQQVALLAE